MSAQHGATRPGARRDGVTGRQAAGSLGRILTCLVASAALFAAMAPGTQAAPAAAPNQGTVWAADMAAAREAAGRDGKPILILALRSGDVAGMDCRHWLEEAAVAATVRRFHPVLLPPSAQAGASGLFPDPQAASPWDNQSRFATGSRLAFLTPAGKGVAVVPVPPTRRGLLPLLGAILADPRPLDAVAAAAAAAPKDTALVDCALERLRQAGQVGPALALTRAVVTAAPEAARPARKVAAEELSLTAADLLAGGFARLAGRLAELAKSAPAGSTRLEALRPLLPLLNAGLPGATGAFPEAVAQTRKVLEEAATEENATKVITDLAPLAKTRADELRRQARDLRKSYAAAHPEHLAAQLWRLRNALDNENDNRPGSEPEARKLLAALLARPMSAEESLTAAGSLAEIVLRLDLAAERGQLVTKLEREAPVGRGAAEALLDLADEALAQGARDEAERCWRIALAASDEGESPTFQHAARVARSTALGKESPAGALWAGRRVLDVVVLVRDMESFAAAIARWSDKEFFPVLFADDLYAPRFVAAFRPAQVVVLPPHPGTKPEASLAPERLRAAVLAAWGTGAVPTAATPEDLQARLRALSIAPPGVVFGDGVSGETAGALALAAGRFQGFEVLPVPAIGEADKARPARPGDHLSEQAGGELAAHVHQALQRWGALPDDGWSAVTLAGAYPYRYTGEVFGQWGHTYALDDLIGRAEDGSRVAVSGRLLGDAARSAYQAACSLFLQPDNALLFNTYGTNPASIWGHYRMDFTEAALGPLLAVTHDRNKDASVEGFRTRTAPWNRHALLTINSSGGATSWSVGGGGGTPDDFPIGVPSAIHVTHSGSAGDPYNNDTLAGRALWGGAYWYYGSTAEPFLSSFQPPRIYAPRVAAGAPFAAVFRQRPGQQFWRPWRLMLVGDPLFSLRRTAAARAAYRPGGDPLVAAGEVLLRAAPQAGPRSDATSQAERYTAWLDGLRQARWQGDRAAAHALAGRVPEGCALDGPGLAMALEEDLLAGRAADAAQRWAAAPDASREEYAARVYARQAVGSLMDMALAAKDLVVLRRLLPELLSTRAAGNTIERWLGKLGSLAKEKGETAAHAEWLRPLAADPRWKAYAGPLAAALKASAP